MRSSVEKDSEERVPGGRRLGDGVGVGRCCCFECLRVEGLRVESSEKTYDNDDDNDDDNDTKSNTARAATFTPGHVDRQKTSSGGCPNKEAGTTPSGVSVPAGSLVTVQSCEGPARPVLPGHDSLSQRDTCPLPAGCSRELYVEPGRPLPEPPANPSDPLTFHRGRRKGMLSVLDRSQLDMPLTPTLLSTSSSSASGGYILRR